MLNFSEINNFPTYDGGAFDILKEVAGKYCPEEVKEILEAKSRPLAGPTAPAQGLSLVRVDY